LHQQSTQRLEPRIDGKTNCLSTVQKDNYVLIKKTEKDNNLLIRKLTPIECEKLQTIPPNYTSPISTHQRYKAIGNAWTVDVIAHILKAMPI
jgi:site-specific DNA-cytosine methylase